MAKSVYEVEFKFFDKHMDALLDQNFKKKKVEVEGNSLPSTVEHEGHLYRLRNFDRTDGYPEKAYLKFTV